MYTIEELLEKTDDELNGIVAQVVMDWYWGEWLGENGWLEGLRHPSGEFIWHTSAFSGFGKEWNPVGHFRYGEHVLNKMEKSYDVSANSIRVRAHLLDETDIGRSVCIVSILEVQKVRTNK